VHPPHVPLHAEAQSADVSWPRDHGPRRRLFRNGLNAGILLVGLGVELAQKIDGFKIFASAELVGNPLSGIPRIIEVEHGRDRIHPEAVDVILIQPEQSAGHQKAAHLVAAIVEDEGLPVRMKALARIGVLEQMCAVKVSQPVRVGREVRRHPVQNHADPLLVQIVHQVHEILGCAVARSGGKISRGLVAP